MPYLIVLEDDMVFLIVSMTESYWRETQKSAKRIILENESQHRSCRPDASNPMEGACKLKETKGFHGTRYSLATGADSR